MLRYIANAGTLELDADKCDGCRMCLAVCPQAVFVMANNRAVIMDSDSCMECGACALNCEPGALTVRSGVGCAAGIIAGKLRGTEPVCGCGDNSGSCC